MYLIGVDIGTTHTKVGAYLPSGEELYFYKFRTPFSKTTTGGELDGSKLFKDILDVLGTFLSKYPVYKERDGYLSVSSLGETLIPVSEDGKAIAFGLIWYDRRTIPIYEKIVNTIGKKYFVDHLAKNPGYFYGINKILWFKNNYPTLFLDTKWFLPVSSYIVFSFTGETCMDYSHAVRTMIFDIKNRIWDYDLFEKIDLSPSIFPPLCESGTYVGKIKDNIKRYIGAKGDIFVSSGGHDHLVAALYMGLFRKNVFFNSSGTTESLFIGIESSDFEDIDVGSFLEKGDITCHTVPHLFTLITSMGTGGIAFDWFANALLQRDLAYLSSLKYKENQVFFMPRVLEVHSGPPQSAFLSLGMYDDTNSLYSALLESLIFEFRDRAYPIEIIGSLPEVLRISGGPTKNDVYNQLKSDLFGKIVEVPKNRDATLFGAALLGGIGGGVYRDYMEAHKSTYKIDKVYNPGNNSYLVDKFEKYKDLKERYEKFLLDR